VLSWLVSAQANSLDVAFYGGSFTALPPETQRDLLLPLQPLRQSGKVRSIRISTRPDALSGSSVALLRELGVELVELGVQSMNDQVLAMAGRGHLARDTVKAFALLKDAGLKVGGQLMPGLPGDSAGGALESLKQILVMQPDLLRIYPAVVLKGTKLAGMYQEGSYQPLSLHEAVRLCKVMLHEAAAAGVAVIRAGLQPTDDLSLGGEIVAGPYHPAFRQLAEGERWYDLLDILLAGSCRGDKVTVCAAAARVSDVIGQKRINISRLEEKYGILVSAVQGDTTIGNDDLVLNSSGEVIAANLLRDLGYEGLRPYKKERA
jgi:histone acetyltransferase (RNA polymerase elongator complex component)